MAPPTGSEPPPDSQTQIERAERFGHNLTHVSAPSSGEAPVQRMKWWEKLLGKSGASASSSAASKPLLADDEDADDGGFDDTPLVSAPPPSSARASVSASAPSIGPLPALPASPPAAVPLLAPPPESAAARAKRLAREADRAKLGGMFDVVDQHDIAFGSDKPNTVTRQELDEIVNLYTGIREGTGNLRIANQTRTAMDAVSDNAMDPGDFDTFKGKTMDDIAKILQTPQGRTVLKSLAAGGKTGASRFNIGTVSNPGLTSAQSADATTASDGTGSGGSVHYSPGTEVSLAMGADRLPTTSDTALFHELLHNYHYGQGTKKTAAIGAGAGIPAQDVGVLEEEYATVGLGAYAGDALTENAYRASHRTLAGANQGLKDKYKQRTSYK